MDDEIYSNTVEDDSTSTDEVSMHNPALDSYLQGQGLLPTRSESSSLCPSSDCTGLRLHGCQYQSADRYVINLGQVCQDSEDAMWELNIENTCPHAADYTISVIKNGDGDWDWVRLSRSQGTIYRKNDMQTVKLKFSLERIGFRSRHILLQSATHVNDVKSIRCAVCKKACVTACTSVCIDCSVSIWHRCVCELFDAKVTAFPAMTVGWPTAALGHPTALDLQLLVGPEQLICSLHFANQND